MKKHRITKILTAILASASIFTFSANVKSTQSTVQAVSSKSLPKLNYSGKDIVTVNGNKNSKIYHVMNGQNYHISKSNAVYFPSEAVAKAAGYRKSLR